MYNESGESSVCSRCGYPAKAGHSRECGENKQETSEHNENLEKVEEQIKEIFDFDKYVIMGHGSMANTVDSVMEAGLKTAQFHPGQTTLPFPTEPKAIYDMLKDWPYEKRKSILIITLPKPEGKFSPANLWERALEHKQTEDGRQEPDMLLPAKYMKCYFDTEQNKFFFNEKFNPEPLKAESAFTDQITNSESVQAVVSSTNTDDQEPW